MNLKNRQQLLGVVAIVGVGLLVGDHLIFSPLTRLWKERSEQIGQFKNSVEHGNQLLDRERAVREQWDQMRTNTLASDRTIAATLLIADLDHWSQASRITLANVSPHWTMGADDDYATYDCRIDGSGNLAQITRFIYELEKDPLGLKVDSVELQTRDDHGKELTLGLQLSGLQLNPPSAP